ncbi:MAG: DMT family transporter [Lentisphaerae bacterium]|nr:DMT family transporter [Lentisphaerota bacterium]MCP4102086.1 DMT family transporter [Lentisphaerota bacterium]
MNYVKKNIFAGWFAAILVAVIWGVTGVVAKPLTSVVNPIILVFYCYVAAAVGLILIFSVSHRFKSLNKDLGSSLKIEKKDIARIAFCGIVGQGCFALFNFLSLSYITVTSNGVVQGMQPFATIFFGIMFFHFRMNKIQWTAFILSAICIVLMTMNHSAGNSGSGNTLLGVLLVTCSMLSLAWTSYLRNSLSEKYGSVVSMLYQYISVAICGFIIVYAMGLKFSQIAIILSSPLLICLLLFSGIVISGGSYLIQLYSFKRIGVEKSTMALNLVPLVSYIFAVFTLGEPLLLGKTILILIIVTALYVFTKYGTNDCNKIKTSSELKLEAS